MQIGNRKYEPHYDARHGFYFTHLQVGRKRKYFGLGTNRKDADKKLKALLLQKSRGELVTDVQTTLRNQNGKRDIAIEELAHEHLSWCEIHRAKATYELRKNFVRLFLRFLKEGRNNNVFWVSELDLMVLENFIGWVIKNNPRVKKGGFEHNRHIKTFLRWGYERGFCELPRLFPRIKDREADTKRFYERDFQAILTILTADIAPIVIFGVETGLRPKELTSLKKTQVELNGSGKWSINIAIHKTSDSAKTYKPRSVPLSDRAYDIFLNECTKHPDAPYVFLNKQGRPFATRFLSQKMKRLCRRAKIDPRPIYSTRHTCASVMSDNGADLKTVADLLGHSNIRTTTRYIKNNEECHRRAVQNVADFCLRLEKSNGQKTERTDRVTDRGASRKNGSPQDKDTTA